MSEVGENAEFSSSDIQIVHDLSHFADREGERFWQRNGFFVTVISAIFGVLFLSINSLTRIEAVFLGSLGAVISVSWYYVLRISKYYAERWRKDARKFLEGKPDLAKIYNTVAGKPLMERPRGPASSKVFEGLASISAVFWLGLAAVGLFAIQDPAAESPATLEIEGARLVCDPGGAAELEECSLVFEVMAPQSE